MSEERTPDTLRLPPFEERVLARLEDLNARLASLESETKPNWERLLNEFKDMNASVKAYLTNFDRKLDVINSELLQLKANQRDIESRVVKIETEARPQVIIQDHQF